MEMISVAFIEKIFSSDYAYIVSLISIAGLIVTYLSSIRTKNYDTDKERLETVISPLFEISEKYMGKTKQGLTEEQIKPLKHIIAASKPLSGGILRGFEEYALIPFSVESKRDLKEFESFLAHVSREYDRLCKRIGIPVRSWKYRLTHYRARFSSKAMIRLIVVALLKTALDFSLLLFFIGILAFAVESIPIEIFSSETILTLATGVILCMALLLQFTKTSKK